MIKAVLKDYENAEIDENGKIVSVPEKHSFSRLLHRGLLTEHWRFMHWQRMRILK